MAFTGKNLSSSLSTRTVFFYAVSIVCAPFQFGVQSRMWISFVSVPDDCLFIYFEMACLLMTDSV